MDLLQPVAILFTKVLIQDFNTTLDPQQPGNNSNVSGVNFIGLGNISDVDS